MESEAQRNLKRIMLQQLPRFVDVKQWEKVIKDRQSKREEQLVRLKRLDVFIRLDCSDEFFIEIMNIYDGGHSMNGPNMQMCMKLVPVLQLVELKELPEFVAFQTDHSITDETFIVLSLEIGHYDYDRTQEDELHKQIRSFIKLVR